MDPVMSELIKSCETIVANKIDLMETRAFSTAYQVIELKIFLDDKLIDSSINPAAKCIFKHLVDIELFRLSN